ncbi:hypothetical protein DAEQUDRAFT_515560 [Daedalea quercina L-15889]|uniref:C2H2-type domain-containing protein n=1 Tax=Daedalea quercina L-15889 TaxID=1314783 RepID=A0A165MFB9_9APHY|nr:hypothetical protein DAEQUDRAFT_515560 [Daedalea quercina L-15889]
MGTNPASSPPLSPGHHSRAHLSSSSSFTAFRDFSAQNSQPEVSFSSVVAAIQHCSELRTKMEDTVVAMANQGPYVNPPRDCSCPPSTSPAPIDCEECAHDCESAPCDVGLSSECTDQCVVVACNDAHHSAAPCDVAVFPAHCEPCNIACEDSPDCTGLEEFCCPDYHGYMSDPKSYSSDMAVAHPDLVWDPQLAAFLCGCSDPQGANLTSGFANMSTATSTTSTPQLTPSPVAFHSQTQQFLQSTSMASHNHAQVPQVPGSGSQYYSTPQSTQSPQPQVLPHRCQWGGCFASFASLAELVGHVNLQHLRLASGTPPLTSSLPHPVPSAQQSASHGHGPSADGLSCMWADCQVYPSPQSIPGPSTGNALDNALGVLASHLLEDHLGLPLRSTKEEQASEESSNIQAPTPSAPNAASDGSSGVYSPPTPLPEHDCAASPVHVCRWRGCMNTFPTCDELTAHITAEHVGAGKAQYECHWEGCTRHGEKGFSSKQKILRHLQSHTGHRPFQCEICSQFFSEAATLAQHKRRHTQEKPYVCDFPGCGKSFAITGALTIHKRTHNGHKPFKCTYCDRAFAESSNLSKHLRTHTGARPYPCTEPGCNKSFARPDQLARHQNVHRKRSAEVEAAA